MNLRLIVCFTLMCLPLASNAQERIEGKLFSSPDARDYLDYQRKDFLSKNKKAGFDIQESQIPEIPGNSPTAAASVVYSLKGIMKRSDGRLAIWFNDQQLTEQQLPSGVRVVRDGASLALQIRLDNGKSQLLRAGQAIDLNTGILQEHYHLPAPPAATPAAKPDSKTNSTTAPAAPATTQPAPATGAANSVVAPTAAAPTSNGSPIVASADSTADEIVGVLFGKETADPQAVDAAIKSLQALRDRQNADKKQ